MIACLLTWIIIVAHKTSDTFADGFICTADSTEPGKQFKPVPS
jgi:hypothetical protein